MENGVNRLVGAPGFGIRREMIEPDRPAAAAADAPTQALPEIEMLDALAEMMRMLPPSVVQVMGLDGQPGVTDTIRAYEGRGLTPPSPALIGEVFAALHACFNPATGVFDGSKLQGGPYHRLFVGMTARAWTAFNKEMIARHGRDIREVIQPMIADPRDALRFASELAQSGIGTIVKALVPADHLGPMVLDYSAHERLERIRVRLTNAPRDLTVIVRSGVIVEAVGLPVEVLLSPDKARVRYAGSDLPDFPLEHMVRPAGDSLHEPTDCGFPLYEVLRRYSRITADQGFEAAQELLGCLRRDDATWEYELVVPWDGRDGGPDRDRLLRATSPKVLGALSRYAEECGGELTTVTCAAHSDICTNFARWPSIRRLNLSGADVSRGRMNFSDLRAGCELNLIRCTRKAADVTWVPVGTALLFDGKRCSHLGMQTTDKRKNLVEAALDPFRGGSVHRGHEENYQVGHSDVHRDMLLAGIKKVSDGDYQGYDDAIAEVRDAATATHRVQRIVYAVAGAVPRGKAATAMLVPQGAAFHAALPTEGDRRWYVRLIAGLSLSEAQRAQILEALAPEGLGELVRQELSATFLAAGTALDAAGASVVIA